MACELDEAFERARGALPDEWMITELKQDSAGWTARATRKWYDLAYNTPTIGARGRTLTKSLLTLAEKLENYAQSAN